MPENKMNPDKILASFLDEIVAVKGVGLSKAERLSLRDELRGEMDAAVDAAMIAALPEEKLVELNRLTDSDASEDDIEGFFASVEIDFDKVALSAMLQFKKDQIGAAGQQERATVSADPAGDANATVNAADTAGGLFHDMTQNTQQNDAAAPAPMGAPVQGTVSAQPGMSDVEGIARMVAAMSEGGENA